MGDRAMRRAKGRDREQRVVDAAAQVIAERGLANVRIADVADRAGMTAGHVSYYFPTKTGLLVQAIRQSEEAFTDGVGVQIRAIDDPWERLTRYFELAAAGGPADPGWVLWLEVWSSAANDPLVAKVHEELDARSRQILQEVIGYGLERGSFVCRDVDETARLLAAVVDGLSIQLTLGADGLDHGRVVELCQTAARAHLAATL